MQFLPSTWAAIGHGNINDPRDAILAAARFLAVHGGPRDMTGALYSYNPSRYYVAAITSYAQVMQRDPRAYYGYYYWQVIYRYARGDVILRAGYDGRHTARR